MTKKILIIRLGSLGDIILTSAPVINLKIHYPDSRLTFLCKERYRPVVELIEGVDEIVTLPENISAAAYYNFILELDNHNFDIVVDLHRNFRSWLARKLITADQTVTYPKRRYGRLAAVRRKVIPKQWPHTVDLYNYGIASLGVKSFCSRPVLRTANATIEDEIRRFIDSNEHFIVVAPGAAHSNKQWPLERFSETARRIHRSQKLGVVWAITSADREGVSPSDDIARECFLEVVDYPVRALASLISLASVTIANDSGIAHLSSAIGTPVVAIFGPTHPVLGFAPRGLYDVVVEVDEYCRPCSLHGRKPCYRDQRYCLERIEAATVVTRVLDVLRSTRGRARAAFVDRDGTVIVDKHFLSDPDLVEFEDGSIEALRVLKEQGFKVIVISNQSGVARGLFDLDAVENVNHRLLELVAEQKVGIDGIHYCPHHPSGTVNLYIKDCRCRKPAPGMAEEAAYQLGLDLRKSYVIGDKIDDINLARVIGATPILVRSGYGRKSEDEITERGFHSNMLIADNLLEAARSIVASEKT
ncbi:MAG: HAD-IIIA family hydrolase [Candidatus Zixiibacteriota bacterium]|nr:MAG: HAD-IIIA family hydrolase [candidate division Zixibacteria bacterium]